MLSQSYRGYLNHKILRSLPTHPTPIMSDSESKTSYFLNLPPEIRIIIYELAVTLDEPREFDIGYDWSGYDWSSVAFPYPPRPTQVKEPAITMTNRQTRQESLPLFYSRNTFRADCPHLAAVWLRRLHPAKRAFLKSVHASDAFALNMTDARTILVGLNIEFTRTGQISHGRIKVSLTVMGEGVVFVTLEDLAGFEEIDP